MGAAPSTQDDLLCLKSPSASRQKRQQAFQRLRNTMVRTLSAKERLAAIDDVQRQRYPVLWPRPPPTATRLSDVMLADRVKGCLFGAALGDAAGLATEFMNSADAVAFYGAQADFSPGRDVFPDEHRIMWCSGDWTDDTDQLILILQSLLHSGGIADPIDFAGRLHNWRRCGFQELGDESGVGLGQTTKAVLNDPKFLSDPHGSAYAHSRATPSNGGVMRTAAAGIPCFWDESVVVETSASLCRTTHADPRCVVSCIIVALCVSRLLQGMDLEDGVAVDPAALQNRIIGPAVVRARAYLEGHCSQDISENESLAALAAHVEVQAGERGLEQLHLDETGRIGYTFKCLGAGLWALRSETGFRETLNNLISCAGDADTNATVAGALLGCRLGYSQLPHEWIKGMPYSSWLEAYVQKALFMLGLR